MERDLRKPVPPEAAQKAEEASGQTKSFDNLRNFVTEAMRLGVHFMVPQVRGQTTQNWNTQWQMLVTYIHTDASLAEIGRIYDCTKQNVHLINLRATQQLYTAAPKDLQDKHPISGFDYKKLQSGRKTTYEYDRAISLLASGKTMKEVAAELGIPYGTFAVNKSVRETLTSSNYTLRGHSKEYRALLDKLDDPSSTSQERQTILDEMTTTVKGTVDYPIIKLASLLKEANLKAHGFREGYLLEITEAIRSAGIPIRVIESTSSQYVHRYGIIAKIDREAVLKVLQTSPELDHLRR